MDSGDPGIEPRVYAPLDEEARGRVIAELRRIMLVCPTTWKCASMDDATVRTVWEEELDQSEKDRIVMQYGYWRDKLDPPMAVVRWRAAVRPFMPRP